MMPQREKEQVAQARDQRSREEVMRPPEKKRCRQEHDNQAARQMSDQLTSDPAQVPQCPSLATRSSHAADSTQQLTGDIQISGVNSPTFIGHAAGITFNYNFYRQTGSRPQSGPETMTSTSAKKQSGETIQEQTPKYRQHPDQKIGRPELEPEKISRPDAIAEELKKPARWVLMTEIKTFGCHRKTFQQVDEVEAFSNNEIVVLDDKHKELITFLLDRTCQSTVHSRDLQLKGLLVPSHVAVNKGDQLIILDCPTVKIFNRGYQSCLHQFNPGRYTQGKPSCLAVDDSNRIAVGFEEAEKISLHEQDGSLIRQIPAPMISRNMTIYKQKIIYTSFKRRKLLSVDFNGRTVFKVDVPDRSGTEAGPNGLCCDSKGNIYVTNTMLELKQGDILQFSPDGKYIGCAVKKCGLPADVTITPSGEMVIAAVHSVEIYQCHWV